MSGGLARLWAGWRSSYVATADAAPDECVLCRVTGPDQPAPNAEQGCWVSPPLPGAKPGQIPHILKAKYPNR